ncbi:MAG: WD40 repeat domain-containing protein, partial [Planctomycetota bacterium]
RKPVIEYHGHTGDVLALDVSPDFQFLATACSDGVVRVFKVASGVDKPITYEHEGPATAVCFGPTNLAEWNARDGAQRIVVSGGTDRHARAMALGTQTKSVFTDQDSQSPVTSIVMTPNGQRFVTGHDDGRCVVWATYGGAKQRELRVGGAGGIAVRSLAVSGATTVAAGTADGQLVLWDAGTGSSDRTIVTNLGAITATAFTDKGAQIVVGTERGLMRRWKVTGESAEPPTATRHGARITGLASPGKDMLVSVSRDGTGLVWNTATGELAHDLGLSGDRNSIVAGLVRDNSGSQEIIAVRRNGQVSILAADTGRELANVDALRDSDASCAAITPDGKILLVGNRSDRGNAVLVELDSRRVLHTLGGVHTAPLTAAAISPDGNFAATADAVGRIAIWALAQRQKRLTIEPINEKDEPVVCLRFGADSRTLYVGSGTTGARSVGHARVVDVIKGSESMREFQANQSRITAIMPLPDNTHALVCSSDGQIVTYKIADGRAVGQSQRIDETGDFVTALYADAAGRVFAGTARGVVIVFRKP